MKSTVQKFVQKAYIADNTKSTDDSMNSMCYQIDKATKYNTNKKPQIMTQIEIVKYQLESLKQYFDNDIFINEIQQPLFNVFDILESIGNSSSLIEKVVCQEVYQKFKQSIKDMPQNKVFSFITDYSNTFQFYNFSKEQQHIIDIIYQALVKIIQIIEDISVYQSQLLQQSKTVMQVNSTMLKKQMKDYEQYYEKGNFNDFIHALIQKVLGFKMKQALISGTFPSIIDVMQNADVMLSLLQEQDQQKFIQTSLSFIKNSLQTDPFTKNQDQQISLTDILQDLQQTVQEQKQDI